MMAKRKIGLGELAQRINLTPANLSILKTGKAKAIRFSTLEAICKVLECQKVPKADKLLQFKIDDGLGGRTIVSGIAEHYNPADLIGKNVCFIANLEPRKLKGIESQGMILSAENADGSLTIIQPMKEVLPGSEVK